MDTRIFAEQTDNPSLCLCSILVCFPVSYTSSYNNNIKLTPFFSANIKRNKTQNRRRAQTEE